MGIQNSSILGFKLCQSFNSVVALWNTDNKAVTNEEKNQIINCTNIQYVAKKPVSLHFFLLKCYVYMMWGIAYIQKALSIYTIFLKNG